ncbi:hypothetical protein CCACVL1_10683 [Corchorus capsularis]|uniref:Uncharacterized protein n=1 Tax=Corchorus capsularis TaxID=210143 RepID=A0A1R3IQ89_COCAP|nr:hypothetical protein CCACVL1_10683 [Corchorus capsularis]
MALQRKLQERSTLVADKEQMLADIEIKKQLFDDFMIFITAVENKDLDQRAQKFDEKAMMEAVVTKINGHGSLWRQLGGFNCFFGAKGNNKVGFEKAQIPDEESMVVLVEGVVGTQAIEGTRGGDGSPKKISEMDPRERGIVEASLQLFEVKLAMEAEKNRLMEVCLRADQAALRMKERECSILGTEKERLLELNEAGEILVDTFFQLEAYGNMNVDDQNLMMAAIVAWMNSFGGGSGGQGRNGGGFGGA